MKMVFGGIFSWYNNNKNGIIVYGLISSLIALWGLSVYLVVDYSKYKKLIEKLKLLEQINSAELETGNSTNSEITKEDNDIEIEKLFEKPKGGKHF